MTRFSNKQGAYLRAVRNETGVTLQQVADALGVTKPYVSDVETGKRQSFPPKYWASLLKILPELDVHDLRDLAIADAVETARGRATERFAIPPQLLMPSKQRIRFVDIRSGGAVDEKEAT